MDWHNSNVGDVLCINTRDGEYQGVVQVIDDEGGYVLLKKVISNGKQFHGAQCFYDSEILRGKVVNTKKNRTQQNPVVDQPSLDANNENVMPDPPEELVTDAEKEKQNVKASREANKIKFQNKLQRMESYFFDEPNEGFDAAITHLKTLTQISLSTEGVDVGRNGCLCWTVISTDAYIFHFDMLHYATSFFERGLKSILEDPSVTKIVHDCRQMSDCFYHRYGVELRNVFDTQVADVFVYKLFNNGNVPRYVKALSASLLEHLNLENTDVYFPVLRITNLIEDQLVWKKRPLPDNLVDAAAKNVIYLSDLMEVVNKKLRSEMDIAMGVYLGTVRDAREHEIAMMSPHLLPPSFQMLVNRAFGKRAGQEFFRHEGKSNVFDHHGFKNNHVHIPNPDTVYTRDSWHESQIGADGDKERDQKDEEEPQVEIPVNTNRKPGPQERVRMMVDAANSKPSPQERVRMMVDATNSKNASINTAQPKRVSNWGNVLKTIRSSVQNGSQSSENYMPAGINQNNLPRNLAKRQW